MANRSDEPNKEADTYKKDNDQKNEQKKRLFQIAPRREYLFEDGEKGNQKQNDQQQIKCDLGQNLLGIR